LLKEIEVSRKDRVGRSHHHHFGKGTFLEEVAMLNMRACGFFKKRRRQAKLVRAREFMTAVEADKWRWKI
jgi:hypothetical protein